MGEEKIRDEEKPRPVMHSSVAAMKAATDAKNASQKADLAFLGPDPVKKLTAAVESIQKQILGLRERIEVLESEDGIGGVPYSDGSMERLGP